MTIHAILRRSTSAQLRRAGLAGIVALAAALALAPAAGARLVKLRPPPPGPSWSITPSPNPPGATGSLMAVSCTAGNACTAVGTSASFPHPLQALAERWNGVSWTIQPTNPAFSSSNVVFNGVSCTSASSCLAVGQVAGSAVSELWNGKTWNLMPAMLKPGAVSSTANSVSCTSASNCMAVGSYADSSNIEHTLALLWNGSFWASQSTLDPLGATLDTLNSVSCASATSCLAVGENNGRNPLYESWNGRTWSAGFGLANHTTGASFGGVSCRSTTACYAVGENFNLAGEFTLANLINPTGLGVSFFTTPSPGKNISLLNAVSCPGGLCLAVGKDNDFSGTFVTHAELYDGSSPPNGWSTMSIPTPTNSSGIPIAASLNGISCPSSSDCIAVGSDTAGTLAEQLTGVAGPHALSLTRRGQVIALLHRPRTLELLLFKVGSRGGRLLGAVTLGRHGTGRSLIAWNLRVNDHRLAPGTYIAELVATLPGGAATAGPSVTFQLASPAGPVRVLSSTCSIAAATSGRC